MKKHVISLLAILLVLIFTLTSCGDSEYIAELESQIEDLNQEILDKNEENEKLKEELSAKDGELNTLKSNIKQIEDEILALESKDAENLSKIAELEADYSSKVAELEANKKANAEALAALEAAHKAEVEGLEGNIEELETAYNNKVSELEANKKANAEALAALEAAHKAAIEALETENANLALQIAELEARIEELLNDKDYIVTFDVNGGEGSVEDQTVRYKKTVDEPTAPTKAHYDFLGWYVGGVKVEFPYVVTANTEFVAEYAPTKYTVSYVVNDGTMPENYVTEYDVETPVTLPTPTRDLYLFDGWYEDAKFEGEKVREIKAGEFGNRTFYAKWLSTTNGITYQLANNDTTYTVTGYDGSDTVIVIPDSVGGIPVTAIAKDAFKGKQRITSITVPDSVTSIGSDAFRDCSSLVSVVIGDSVTSIGSYAFSGCDSLVSVTIPDSVEFIGSSAFEYCASLYVVYNSSDLLLEIGSSNNGYLAYYAKILVDNGETIYANDGYNYTLTNEGFLFREKDSKYELIYYVGGENTVTLPENINSNSYDLYRMRGVVNVIIPESFTTINDYAFYDCDSLASVVIPDSVTTIGNYAFANCNSLVSVVIPDSVTSIGESAFYGCDSLVSVVIPDSVTSIGNAAFANCNSLVSVTIPDSVTSIGSNAFWGCSSLASVVIGDSVTSIDSGAFYNCSSLVSVVIGDSVTTIGYSAFRYCTSLAEVYYNGSVAEWNSISISYSNDPLENATRYYYSENQPTEEGNFWHWVDGEVKIWE